MNRLEKHNVFPKEVRYEIKFESLETMFNEIIIEKTGRSIPCKVTADDETYNGMVFFEDTLSDDDIDCLTELGLHPDEEFSTFRELVYDVFESRNVEGGHSFRSPEGVSFIFYRPYGLRSLLD